MLIVAAVAVIGCAPSGPAARQLVSASPGTTLRISGSGTATPAIQKLGERFSRQTSDTQLAFSGGTNSGGAIRGVLEGTLDVAVTNRPLTEAEVHEPLVYRPIVRDAVTFAVNRSASIRGLRTSDVQDLYDGAAESWKGLGGPDAPVVILDRDPDESMRKLVLLPLLAGHPVMPQAVTLTSAADMLHALDTTPNAVGYSSLGLIRLREPRNVVVLLLDDVAPSAATLASGAYPWSLTFGLVVRSDAPDATRVFVEHAARSARDVLGDYDYVPVDD